jgi:hypothetical protein
VIAGELVELHRAAASMGLVPDIDRADDIVRPESSDGEGF